MMVLLKEAVICATPSATFFLTFLRTRAAAALFGAFAMMISLNPATNLNYFFSDCAALRGHLRVRALVRVRWPRAGQLRRADGWGYSPLQYVPFVIPRSISLINLGAAYDAARCR